MNDIFESLKEKSIKEVVQFFSEAGFTVPVDEWFDVMGTYKKDQARWIIVDGVNNRMSYVESGFFSQYKYDNREKYAKHIKNRAKQRISRL